MDRYVFPDAERKALEGLQQPLAIYQFVDGQVVTLLVSDGFCKLMGDVDREQAIREMDHDMYRGTHPDDKARVMDAAVQFATRGGDYKVVYRTKIGAGSDYRVLHAQGKHVTTETGARLAQVWYMDEGQYIEGEEDAGTKMNRQLNSALHEESILRGANYDALTGLPSLPYFFKLCEVDHAQLFTRENKGCLLYIDLNGMKYYNHMYGFLQGDMLLKAFAGRLAELFGHESCCHIGADRFAVATTEDGLEEKLQHFFDATEQTKDHLPIRVGIATDLKDVPVSSAYDRAKMACDAIPKTESSCYRYYTKEFSDAMQKRRYIQANLDSAIANRWINVYYQPIVRAVNERVCGEEALARWIDPELGFLSPAEFIPELEASGQIYKLDLYVLERVLEKMKLSKMHGLNVVPHSINLSRADFDACDIVEEIRKRVDEAGIRRDMITVEITESIIGNNLDFMKKQVERFRMLGFPVWMDDFGSGYSSLNVLQSIQFDLIKFDMSFMQKLNEGGTARAVLTDLMRLAASLGIDTVCEGVETENQVRFLQEIGCSKMQGFHYSKPIPFEAILKKSEHGMTVRFEDPESSSYFESIGRINVYDLDMIASREESSLRSSFDTIPIGIIEVRGETNARIIRSNPSYREFMWRYFGIRIQSMQQQFIRFSSPFMCNLAKNCKGQDGRAIFDEELPDGSIVHSFARRIGLNPKTGDMAVAVAILSISEQNEGMLTERLLTEIEQFGEHLPGGFFICKADGKEELLYANKAVCDIFGCDSLEDFKAFSGFRLRGMVHPEDYERAAAAIMEKKQAGQQESVEYRIRRKDGEIRWIDGYSHYMETDVYHGLYYVFITDITSKYQQAESDKALRSAVIEALTKPYNSVWLINDIQTQQFDLYRINREVEHFMPAQAATKINKYYDAFVYFSTLVMEEDRQRFLEAVTPESIARNTENKTIYSVPFRRVFPEGVRNYRLEFARIDLANGETNIVGGFKDVSE